MKKEKAYIVTGCAGLLGSKISDIITFGTTLPYGHVIGIDNLFSGYINNLPKRSNFHFIEKDLHSRREILEKIKEYNFDIQAVIHTAALPYEGVSVFSPFLISNNIVPATNSIASIAIELGIPLFINFSSMARYGNQTPPFTEDMPTKGVDPYGLSKIQAEEQLNLLSEIHGLKVYHVVPHNVSGPGQIFTDPYRNVLSIFINRHLHGEPPIIYGDGLQKRSFSHVLDCVGAILNLVNNPRFDSGEVFNIGPDDGTEITVRELASIVAKTLNKEDDVIYMPPRPREVKDAWVSIEKAKKLLNYSIHFDVETTVWETANWIKNQPLQPFRYHLDLEIKNESTPKTWTERLM